MKNRYGMDGMTFSAKIDTSTGHFEVTDHHFDGDETPPSNKFASNANFNSLDRELLAQQFFQLNS